MSQKQTVAVGLSGGVDSSVTAAILLERGYHVVGMTMLTGNIGLVLPDTERTQIHGACIGPGEEEDIAACKRLCTRLGIEHHSIDVSEIFEARVLKYFKDEYNSGRTPNPCIVCNSELKFKFLLEQARTMGIAFDLFATGHYARIEHRLGKARLRAAVDQSKDQSYFLYRLGPETLEHTLFPLGDMKKDEVRSHARSLGLEVADKPDSQDFIAGGDIAPIFADNPPPPGDIVDISGRVLGRHRGIPFYTIGQRRGLGIGAVSGDGAEAQPYYVIALDAEHNRVVVGADEELFAGGLVASDFRSYDSGSESSGRGYAKIRQNHKPTACTYTISADGECRIEFDIAQRAIAPGQSVVIYDEEGFVLGGGVIERALP
jgi:tRNA-specific 2-thiouridylase